jgi:Tfp pilus assembly protein FimT
MLIVIVIIVLLAAMAAPATAKQLRHGRLNQAANVVAADLENAVSYAARLRKPVRITRTSATSFTVTDRTTGDIIQRRELGTDTEWKLASITFSTTPVDVFPAGITSGSLTVSLAESGYTSRVRLSRAGLAQVVR